MSALVDDPEARAEYLFDRGVLVEGRNGVVTSEDFHATLEIYEDTYLEAPESDVVESVAHLFDLEPEAAAERIEETGMTRQELATFLALRSYLDDPERTRDELAMMAAVVAETDPASPVPGDLTEITDETFEAYIEEHGDVVVLVFQRHCAPCEAMKDDLPEILAAVPDGVAVAGVDGDEAIEFRRAHRVGVAPTTLLFSGGERAVTLEGRKPAEDVVEAIEAVHAE